MIEDRILYAVAKHSENDQFPRRFELGFKNLTKGEAAQLLMTLDKLQTDRKTALYLGDVVELDVASKPEVAGREFAREHGLDPVNLTNTTAREFAGEHGVNLDTHFLGKAQ